MALRILFSFALLLSVTGCKTLEDAKKKEEEPTSSIGTLADPSTDPSFQAFLGRLRQAVTMRDMHMIASMMTTNFGYLLEPTETYSGEGEGVFQYWDENNLWPELNLILQDRFTKKGRFMVSPPEFVEQEDYSGFRAGIAQVKGSWKFAYFVSD